MPWLTTQFDVRILNVREIFPFMTLDVWEYYSPLTGETYRIRKYFRTDGASVPIALSALPVVGPMLIARYFGHGVFQGFEEGVLHDFLRRENAAGETVVPPNIAHLILREALYARRYPPDLCESYYAAVRAFNP